MKPWNVCLVLATVLALTIASGSVAGADPLEPFSGAPEPVTIEDVNPRLDRSENRKNEFYSEWWSFAFTLEGGYKAYVQFLSTNLGPGDGKGAVVAEFGLPDGRKFRQRTELDRKDWSWSADRFELRFGDNTISGPLDALRIHVKNDDFEADYALANVAPPWKPGRGVATYGASRDRYYRFELLAPIARVDGRVKVAEDDDAISTVRGYVYADHSASSIGMHEQALRWARFRAADPRATFVLGHIVAPAYYGERPIQFAVLFLDGKVAFQTTRFDLKTSRPWTDPKKADYGAPQQLEVRAEEAGRNLRAVIRATRMTSREDFLESSGPAAAFVLSKFVKPVMYYFDAKFAVEVREEGRPPVVADGTGRYYYTIVNP